MIPIFIFVMSNGDVWVSSQKSDTPTGTVAATFRINSGTHLQKLGTVGGCNGSCTGNTGKDIEKV